jgi:hypothetical protein
MTAAAWIMMGVTWTVVVFFTAKFFWMVLRTPPHEEPEHEEQFPMGPPSA